MKFNELTSQNRRELFDTWLLNKPRPITSAGYRSNISRYYDFSEISKLIQAIAIKLSDDEFIKKDLAGNKNYSTPMRRYLEWVYSYIVKASDTEAIAVFNDEVAKHNELLPNGAYELKIDVDIKDQPLHSVTSNIVENIIVGKENFPHNRIVYGAPGTGKSYLLKQQTDDFSPKQVERVTFHPEYTYFDFVGSYKPVMVEQEGKEVIAYRFEAGPFAKILKKALASSGSKYVLVIEEINRARAAAVFGDLFQLLDRDSEGRSEYGITPARDLANYLTRDNEDGDGVELEGGKLYLPDNLYIWATMNSADQGVFPLDTAFKRRWSFEYIPIDNNEDKITGTCSARWNEIRKHVNKLLQEAGINEDKQMGAFFLKGEELASKEKFLNVIKEKVIMYLYEDAARHQRGQIFKNERARFSELCNIFDGTTASIFREAEGEAHA